MDFIQNILNGTTPTMYVFLGVGVVGLVLLALATLLDGIFDALHISGDGPFSLTSIAAFLSMFGFAGTVVLANGGNIPSASIVGLLAGTLGGGIAFWITRMLQKDDSSTSISTANLQGTKAVVILPIQGNSYGEVAVSHKGFRHTFAARSDTEHAVGETTEIVAVLSETSVKVKSIDASETEDK